MSTDASSRPFPAPAQLRTPVPPQRPRPLVRTRRGLGRPSTWALAVAVLLVGLVAVLLLAEPASLSEGPPAPAHVAAALVAGLAVATP